VFDLLQKEQGEAVALDMWHRYLESVREHLPNAEGVHDRFHVSNLIGFWLLPGIFAPQGASPTRSEYEFVKGSFPIG
jgi:hypothetical protein